MASAKRKQSGNRFRLAGMAAILGGALLLALVATLALSDFQMRGMMNAAHEAGQPTTLAELDGWWPSPELFDDAAPVYRRAFNAHVPLYGEAWRQLPIEGEAMFPVDGNAVLDPAMLLAVDNYLTLNDTYLDLLYEGATLPACRFDINVMAGFSMQLSHLAQMRQAARMLKLDALRATENRDLPLAVHAVIACFAAGDALRNEPILMSQLVRIAVNDIAMSTLEWVFSRQPLTDDLLQELAQILPAFESLDAQAIALIGERCTGMSAFDQSATSLAGVSGMGRNIHGSVATAGMGLYQAAGLKTKDRQSFFTLLTEAIETAQLPPHERQAADKRYQAMANALPSTRLFTRMLAPGLGRTSHAFLRDLAHVRLAVTAVAIERYRLAHGKLPDVLDALTPDFLETLPEDPYTARALQYRKLHKGYLVYAVGINLEDDGGQRERIKKRSSEPLDVVFEVTR